MGKTRLSIGLGIKAIEAGYNVSFVTLDQLMQLLKAAEIRVKSSRRIKQIKSSDLVILGEVGFLPISRQKINKLYDFINELYMKTSIILTGNKGFEERYNKRIFLCAILISEKIPKEQIQTNLCTYLRYGFSLTIKRETVRILKEWPISRYESIFPI